jgi:hypothetical protein
MAASGADEMVVFNVYVVAFWVDAAGWKLGWLVVLIATMYYMF